MIEHFPELVDPASLPRRVLCIAPHADDEVIACGGVLAMHAARGDAVRVLVATGGDGRAAESRAAAGVLGIADVRALGFDDGRLGAAYDLVGRLKRELADFRAELVYAPSAFEHHPDHRACHRAAVAALAGLEPGAGRPELLCYGVHTGPLPAGPRGVLIDITPWIETKRTALARFASQPAELAEKVAACDRGRTLNVDRPEVRALEGFLRTPTATEPVGGPRTRPRPPR